MKEELYGIIEGGKQKKFKESANHPYLTTKTQLELNVSFSSVIPSAQEPHGSLQLDAAQACRVKLNTSLTHGARPA